MRRRRWISIILLGMAVAGLAAADSYGQEVRSRGKRKIVTQVRPVYPELARKLNIAGTVRLLVNVAPGGNVEGMQELGGSPVLVKAALDAVAKIKWEPATDGTKEIVEIKFQPETE